MLHDPATSFRTAGWRWQLAHQLRDPDQLKRLLPGLDITDGMRQAAERYPFGVTPYYLSLVREVSPADPVLRQFIPDPAELARRPDLSDDELGEDERFSPVPGLIHRYPDRVVCIASTTCPVYCRHCTRKRLVGKVRTGTPLPVLTLPDARPAAKDLDQQAEYVRADPAIRDVIISGGEPLMLPTERLEQLVARFRSIPTVEIIRVGTRAPVTVPMRIDDELCEMLERYHPIWVNTQFNHPNEITEESAAACDRLLRHGIPVSNQAVLLAGVNDSPAVMEQLCRALLRIRVRPYYLLQCDPVAGIEHFRTPVARGIEIMKHLFRSVGGLGVPRLVVDAVCGGGKMPITPGYVVDYEGGVLTLRNFDGDIVTYPDGAAT